MPDDVKHYRSLPYTRIVRKVESEGVTEYVAFIDEIPWVRVHADEREEAYLMLDESFDDAIRAMLDAGDEIPTPEGTVERFGEPQAPEPSTGRWSTSREAGGISYDPRWNTGDLDPKPELESPLAT